jgi:exopolysaccharide biosynthesis protein
MKFLPRVAAWAVGILISLAAVHAEIVVTPWIPSFKGVDRAVGTNYADETIPRLQVVNCVRVDLTDPDVQLFPTPRHPNYIADSSETASTSVSNFLKVHSLKVAVNAGFYWSYCCGGSNPSEGSAAAVFGLSISRGQVVSVADGPPPNDSNPRAASLMFTTNKQPILAYRNYAPGTNTTGIYSAVSGYYPVLSEGVNIGDNAISEYPDNSFHSPQPRTALGISEDRRYLFLMTIDGRQSHSQGAIDRETAAWLLQFGAWDGITMDGGGSTSMYMADCAGNPVALNRSSQLGIPPYRERIIGAHLGIEAKPLEIFIAKVSAVGGSTTATITWMTVSNSTTQVQYGTTPSYGTFSPLDSTLVTNHSVTLANLNPGTRYYFRVLSSADGTQYSSLCANSFTTTNFASGVLVGITQKWRYSTNNLESVNWQTQAFDDSGWSNGPAPMWADSRGFQNNGIPNLPSGTSGTRMPINPATTYAFVTYYLRTPFVYTNSLSGVVLISSNYIDDGAVFYLNGSEVFRTNMPAGQIFNSTAASSNACPPNNNAVCPLVFNLSGSALNNLVVGTNIFAVELHNIAANSADATYEGALLYSLPPPVVLPPFFTNLVVLPGETNASFTWTTLSNSTAQVQYGTTTNLGSATAVDTNLVRNHAVVVSGLEPLTQYYFRLVSTVGNNQYTTNGTFTTVAFEAPLLTFSNIWRFTTNALDGTAWTASDYDDSNSGWLGSGPALFFIENNSDVFPRGTLLPPGVSGPAFPAYYFRTHFTNSGPVAGYALLFTSFIDDGAVFYLNGTEIQRVRMASGPVAYSTAASACASNSCDATFETPDIFRISGDLLTNIVAGDNVLSAEVHQFGTNDSDIVFGSAVSLVRASASETKLCISQGTNTACLSWDTQFLTLQRAATLTGSNIWEDVPGPIRTSPYCITNPAATTFYRLRN